MTKQPLADKGTYDDMQQPSNVLKGGLLVLGAMSIIGLIDNFVRFIAETHGVWQFHLIRSIFSGSVVILFCLVRGQKIWPKRPIALTIRSFFIAGAMILYFGSLSLIPIAEAGAALFSSPIFMLLFSVLMFGKRIGAWRALAILVGFSGVLLVLKPDLANLGLLTVIPLMAGCLYAMGQLMTRYYCSQEHTLTVLLGFLAMIGLFGLIGMVVLALIELPEEVRNIAPFFLTGWKPIDSEFIFWTVIQALGSMVAVSGLIRGYQIAEPTLIAVFEYSFLVFAGLWGWILWNQTLDALSLTGAVLIVCAGTSISLRNRKSVAQGHGEA